MKRYVILAVLVGFGLWGDPPLAQADCLVRSPATYAVGENIFKDTCDTAGNKPVTLGTLFSGEDQTNNLLMTSGGAVRTTPMASAVTTNTTSSAVGLPIGDKTIYGSVDGTGSVTQTQAIYGGLTSGMTTTNGTLLCTLVLSGTTHAHDQCTVSGPWLFYIIVTTNTTGTSATGVVTAMY